MKHKAKVLFLLFVGPLIFPAQAGDTSFHDGFLRLYHSHTDEVLQIRYEIDANPQKEALQKIKHFMRSRDSGEEAEIDIHLIQLLDHLQDYFGADTLEVICGYRSPDFNKYLKSIGRNVMEDSFHLSGSAVDFHLDEVDEKEIYSYLNRFWQGGLGIYPDNLMLHVDVGPYRRWQQGKFSNRRDIGIFNEKNDLKLRTDKLFYKKGEKIKVSLKKKEQAPLQPKPILEHFLRGAWKEAINLDVDTSKASWVIPLNPSLPHGKMRLKVFDEEGGWQHSNEFYLKKNPSHSEF